MTASRAEVDLHLTVRDILAHVGTQSDLAGVADDDSLLEGGIVDSVAMVDLVASLEDRFGIRVADDELMPEHFDSIAAIARLVAFKIGAA